MSKVNFHLELVSEIQFKLDDLIYQFKTLDYEYGDRVPEINEAITKMFDFYDFLDHIDGLKEKLEDL